MSDYERETTPTEYNWDTSMANAAQQDTINQIRGMSGFGATGTDLSDIQIGDMPADTVGRWIDSSGQLHDTRPSDISGFGSFMDKIFGNVAPILQYGPYVAGAALTAGAGAAAGLGSLASNTIAGGAMGAAAGGVEGDEFADVIKGGLLGAAGGAATTLASPYISEAASKVGSLFSDGGVGGATPGFEQAFMDANPTLWSGGETIVPGYENVFTSGMSYGVDPLLEALPTLGDFEDYLTLGYPSDPYAEMRPFSDQLIEEFGNAEGLLTPSKPLYSYEGQNIFGQGSGLLDANGNFYKLDPDLANYNDWITARQSLDNFGKDIDWLKAPASSGFEIGDVTKLIKPLATIAGLFNGGTQDVPGTISSWMNPVSELAGGGGAAGGFGSAGGGTPSGSRGLEGALASRSKGLFTNPIADEIARFSGQKYYT